LTLPGLDTAIRCLAWLEANQKKRFQEVEKPFLDHGRIGIGIKEPGII
jgi:hypothetical protein